MNRLSEQEINTRLDGIASALPTAAAKNVIHACRVNHPLASANRSDDFYNAYATTVQHYRDVRSLDQKWLLDMAWLHCNQDSHLSKLRD